MQKNRARTLVGAFVTCATVMAGASSTHADDWSHKDAKDDMVWYSGGTTPTPGHTNGDVRSITVKHGPKRLKVTTSFTEFSSETWEISVDARLRVRASTGHSFRFFAERSDHTSWTIRRDGRRLVCPGFVGSVDTGQSLVRWSIPRGCLGRPKFVRISMEGFYSDGSEGYGDDGLRNGVYRPSRPAYGPRLYRD